ncbi:dephospho-CoA kinase [Erysipelothrix urinaevulpis]|uniref:dephospho-CoA kinase n=1 Tax=Erysipelothrix urinaevulpis TaxID=2683717 RepID=UPI00135800CF|nr:dephospho-CoA kinase [Erysipelothrix urinaevulpis]
MIIGITGTMAAGKSSVSQIIKDAGFTFYDTDKMVHDYYNQTGSLYHEIIDLLGNDIVNENGDLNRKKIAEIVFSNQDKLKQLEALVFPQVMQDIQRLSKNQSLIFFEVPLLYEAGYSDFFDKVIVVDADESLRIKRAVAKGIPEDEVIARMARQMSAQEKRERGDYLIENNHSLTELEEEVRDVLEIIKLERSKEWIQIS